MLKKVAGRIGSEHKKKEQEGVMRGGGGKGSLEFVLAFKMIEDL